MLGILRFDSRRYNNYLIVYSVLQTLGVDCNRVPNTRLTVPTVSPVHCARCLGVQAFCSGPKSAQLLSDTVQCVCVAGTHVYSIITTLANFGSCRAHSMHSVVVTHKRHVCVSDHSVGSKRQRKKRRNRAKAASAIESKEQNEADHHHQEVFEEVLCVMGVCISGGCW